MLGSVRSLSRHRRDGRRWSTIVAGLGARLRSASRYRTLPATLALLALPVIAGLARAAASPTAASPTAAGPTTGRTEAPAPSPPPATGHAVRYHIVGCRSRGSSAYLRGPARREVAIGFDDGPAPDTHAFVTMLEKSHAQATFFMIGRQVSSAYRPTLLRELRNGDVLGDHTFTHPDLELSGHVRAQLERTIAVIRSLTGYTPCVFRPPYGDYDESVLHTARSLGLATVLWNVDPSDYTQPGTGAIEQRVLAQVRPGSIIISHDGGGPRGQTLAAYPTIIASLRRRGYRVVTIPELLGFHPVYVPCMRLCEGIGEPASALPRNAIIERAP